MIGNQKENKYDLEQRTFLFAKKVRAFVRTLSRSITNIEDTKQLIRSSGSIGANYIEANEALSKKDFVMRIKISLKETKESRFWLELITCDTSESEKIRQELVKESTELLLIFSTIVKKSF